MESSQSSRSEVKYLTDKGFKYTPGGNVQSVWRKYGWVPPSEYRNDYLFKQNREMSSENSTGREQ